MNLRQAAASGLSKRWILPKVNGKEWKLAPGVMALWSLLLFASPSVLYANNPAVLSASPNPVPAGSGTGTTTVRWSTGSDKEGQVYVVMDGRPEKLALQGTTGSEEITYINTNSTYEFRLYAGVDRRKLLSTVTVTRVGNSGSSINRDNDGGGTSETTNSVKLSTFVAITFALAGACVLLLCGRYYLAARRSSHQVSTSRSVSDTLTEFRWPLSVLLTAVVFVLANHLVLRGLAVGVWDVDGQFFQYQVLVGDYARAGRLIYWDPWSNGGLPILGDPQVGVFSPLNVLIGFVLGGTSLAFKAYWLIVWWLGGLGIMMLARHLQAPAWGGVVVALGFLFCGLYTNNAEHTSWLTGFSFLPLIVWRLDAALCAGGRRQPAIEAGALWGLSALAGYPGYTIITGCFMALWALGRFLFGESFAVERTTANNADAARSSGAVQQRQSIWFVFSSLALVLVVGLVVLSPTYFAFFHEGAGTHTRTGVLDRDFAVVNDALHPSAMATFATSYFTILKQANVDQLWPTTSVVMSNLYTGAIVFALAVFALVTQPRDGWRWWLIGLALLGFGCACGQALPLRGWLYDYFYPMRFFRHPGIFRSYYIFAIAVAALIGTRDLAAALRHKADCRDNQAWTRFVIASFVTAGSALLVFTVVLNSATIIENRALGYSHVAVMWTGICIVALIGLLAPAAGWKRLSIPALLLFLATSDALLTMKMSQFTMVDKSREYVARWQNLDGKHVAGLDLTKNGLRREESACYPNPPCANLNNDQMVTKVPVFNSYATNINDFHLEMANNPILRRAATGTDRVFFAEEARQVAVTKINFAEFVGRAETLGSPPLVIHSAAELIRGLGSKHEANEDAFPSPDTNIESLPAMEKINVNLIRYTPEQLVFNVQCATDGWLLVTDRWARSWQAEINGQQAQIYPANFIFRVVRVKAGENKVSFTYRPLGFPWLILASWGTLIAVVIRSVYFKQQHSDN